LTVIAAFLRACELDGFAQAIKQRRARIDSQSMLFAIHPKRDVPRGIGRGFRLHLFGNPEKRRGWGSNP
jgi:hypothetical protein